MPGIVGIVGDLPHENCSLKLDRMVRSFQNESFYRKGTYAVADEKAKIGWVCHRGSFADCMPICNETGDIKLFIAGEVFDEPTVITGLKARGHQFNDQGAHYLIHLYEELQGEFFSKLNGLFSGFIIDRRQGKSFLFNDRFGMHRVFIHHGEDGFVFSSEAKALLSVLPETREFDPKGLCEFLTCGCTLGNHSLFKGIEILPGGSLLEFANGRLLRKNRYFDRKAWEGQTRLSETEFISQFKEMFPRITRKYISSREPVGMSLTGGLDSRMILACLDIPQGYLPCYTFGSIYRDTFDVKVSRRVAKKCRQTHQVLVLGDDFLSKLPDYLEKSVFLSDGYLGLSGAAELYANSLARKIAPVRLTGNWGSELLRGVRAFKFSASSGEMLHPDLHEFVDEARNTFNQVNGMNRVSFVPFQQAPHQSYGRLCIERSQVIPRAPFLDNELIRLVYQAADTFDGFALAGAIISHFQPSLLAIPTDRGFLGHEGVLIRAGRRAYREALFKAEYWVGPGAPDWLVRRNHLLRLLHLEKNLLGRHKFYHFRKWLRDDLAEYVRETLLGYQSPVIQTYFVPGRLEQNVNDHLNGKRNCTEEIDMMLTVALTFNLFVTAGTAEVRI